MNLFTVKIACTSKNLNGLEEEYYVVADSFGAAISQAKAYFCDQFDAPLDDDIQPLVCQFVSDDVVLPAMVAGK